MSLLALVRPPSPALQEGERSHIEREPIDFALAQQQHSRYVEALHDAGARIVEVAMAPQLPDSVFIEDTALVLGSLAVIARSGAESRRPETATVAAVLGKYCELTYPPPQVHFDGGDILTIGQAVYVGRSKRTNQAAIDYLTTLLRPHDYEVVPVPVSGCLHLKSGVTYLGNQTVLINPQWIARECFARYAQVETDRLEPGASALPIGQHLLMSSSYPRTAKRVESRGFTPRLLDLSEFHRAEGGLTCMSILLDARDRPR
jgi:dimethylargininase